MNIRRFLRHPNTLYCGFVLLVLGLAFGVVTQNMLGLGVAGFGLLLIVLAAAELELLFWRSELEWWDEDDARFESWQNGKQ
jgi:hypothetical protein